MSTIFDRTLGEAIGDCFALFVNSWLLVILLPLGVLFLIFAVVIEIASKYKPLTRKAIEFLSRHVIGGYVEDWRNLFTGNGVNIR